MARSLAKKEERMARESWLQQAFKNYDVAEVRNLIAEERVL